MAAVTDLLNKIKSDELRQDARQSHTVPHTVIVEVDLPLPRLEISGRPSLTDGRKSVRIGSSSEPAADARLGETRQALERILGRKPERYLPSSRSFIVEATGEELMRLAEVPSVVAIWPNTYRQWYAF
jgi:hypothetical protein